MAESLHTQADPEHYDTIVVGAGVGGIYQIKKLADMGVSAILLEAEADLGGTWYRNRYPGARFDSESYTYGYSFSPEVLNEWHWKERFSSQPENLKYLNFVAEKFDLKRHMRFNSRVAGMRWSEEERLWYITTDTGNELSARFVITTLGLLSIPTPPRIDGMETFQGPSFHTFYWPQEPVDLNGKRVAVIGTGATGIQVIAEIADKVESLTVFQRRPNWSAPLNNAKISAAEMAEIRARYDEIFATCAHTPGGFEHEPDRRGFWNVTREERLALWDRLYEEPGFGIWLQNFREIFTDEAANREFSDYIADRIRQRVDDPETAEKLIPKDHGFGVQRVPLESHYFEVYNQDNVELVDISETPISRITPTGIETSAGHFDVDLIVYATGFDAVTGAFDHIEIEGVDGEKLFDKWDDGPVTYLGTFISGFPNLIMVAGPQSASSSSNFPRAIEVGVDWASELLKHIHQQGYSRFEASAEAEEAWTRHVAEMYQMVLMRKAKGWFTGYNSNVEGHEEGRIRHFVYNGGAPKFTATLAEVRDDNYRGLKLDH